jgi:hypothetical protein
MILTRRYYNDTCYKKASTLRVLLSDGGRVLKIRRELRMILTCLGLAHKLFGSMPTGLDYDCALTKRSDYCHDYTKHCKTEKGVSCYQTSDA